MVKIGRGIGKPGLTLRKVYIGSTLGFVIHENLEGEDR
jgi:hypothetical protein